jgi:hypothetical protein
MLLCDIASLSRLSITIVETASTAARNNGNSAEAASKANYSIGRAFRMGVGGYPFWLAPCK